MIELAKCRYCGEIFSDEMNNNYWEEYISHEVSHLDLEPKFRNNLDMALRELDDEYQSEFYYTDFKFIIESDEYYGTFLTYKVTVKSEKLSVKADVNMKVMYINKEIVPTVKEIKKSIEGSYTKKLSTSYKGIVLYDSYLDGNGTCEYMIDNKLAKDILKELNGKRIEIRVIEG